MTLKIRDDRQMRALTGLPEEKINELEKVFTEVYEEEKQKAYEKAVAEGTRQRKPGGGRKGSLPTMWDKLIFALYYLKVYPTFDVLGTQFGMYRSKACENVHNLLPILQLALVRLGVTPQRKFNSVAELRKTCAGLDKILIDVTERAHHRPQDNAKQEEMYSGKKNKHTVKNTIISTVEKVILFVGQTFTGHNHDYSMLKEEFPPEYPWFEHIIALLDLGYQGAQTDYEGGQIEIPHKKPRKSKSNPNPELTAEQKAENRALSKVRIFVENAIGGIKRFGILVQVFRNRRKKFDDDVIALTAGLWNFLLA